MTNPQPTDASNMTEAEALDMAARAAGWADWKEAHEHTWEPDGMRAHAKTIMELAKLTASSKDATAAMQAALVSLEKRADYIAALKAENEALEARVAGLTHERDFHRETADLHADRIEALEAEIERLREALKPFARAQHIMASIDGDRVRCVLTYPPEATHTFTLASLDAARAALKGISNGDR